MLSLCSTKKFDLIQLETKSLSYTAFESIREIADIWDKLLNNATIFLHSSYLRSLENCPPEQMKFQYLVVFKDNKPIGLVYLQIFHIDIDKSIQKKEQEEIASMCLVRRLQEGLKNWILKRAEYDLVICGNILLTGAYGFHFLPEYTNTEQIEIVEELIKDFQYALDKKIPTQLSLIKDFSEKQSKTYQSSLENKQYHNFQVQPRMHMKIAKDWYSYEDYLAAMSSKYRVRAKRAEKKANGLILKELSLQEIEEEEKRIHYLYSKIACNVNFNAFNLHPSYFTELKRNLKEDYKLFAYYHNGKMVAFYTAIFNNQELSAHFLGLEAEYNSSHQIYLNILYKLVELAINTQSQSIDFARTALEIKSSVGAVAEEMYFYLRHRSSISNKIFQILLEYMNPKEEWQPRHPFKD